jgi:hypothetical protein
MDDFSGKLNSILSDSESMNRIREMAASILGEEQKNSQPTDNAINGVDISKIMGIIGKMKSMGNSDREKLLLALRPHLKEERKQRLDNALKILKLIELAPLLKDSGIFNL